MCGGVLRPTAQMAEGFMEDGPTYSHISDQMPPAGAGWAAHDGGRAVA